ncbi:hypothetical protein ACFYXM_28175 [Streptomyces sp. NPDC002476]|uniref:hypothetical protein n=1 Tax=Streptomyces sp. NPDC002476 TaxID=3364648 RepID=UPI00369680E6
MTTPLLARTSPRSRCLLVTAGGLGAALAVLQLAAMSPAVGLLMCALGALCGFLLWLRRNRTIATAVMSTCLTMMWIPAVISRTGEAAGVPEAIASWEVVPMWALTLAVPAGAWLSARHRGSRAVTVFLCHLAISVTALAAAVFPASSLSTAAAATVFVLVLRSGFPAAVRARLYRTWSSNAGTPDPLRDGADRLWLSVPPSSSGGSQVHVGADGAVAVVHRLPPGHVTLARVDNQSGTRVQAYTLNGSASELADALGRFAAEDRALARALSVSPSDVVTLVAAPHAGLVDEFVSIDLAGIWDRAAHQYVDHRVTLLASTGAESHLQHLVVRRRRLTTKGQRAAAQERGDRRQRDVTATAMALR